MESTFSALIKKRRSYFCRSNCYLSDGALWCLCPKLMLFVLQIKKGKRFCVLSGTASLSFCEMHPVRWCPIYMQDLHSKEDRGELPLNTDAMPYIRQPLHTVLKWLYAPQMPGFRNCRECSGILQTIRRTPMSAVCRKSCRQRIEFHCRRCVCMQRQTDGGHPMA